MKSKILVAVLIFSVVLNVVAAFTLGYYWWQAGKFGGHPCPPPGLGPMGKMPFHNPDEREWMESLRNEAMPQIKVLRDSLISEREKLIQLLQEPIPDSIELEKTYNEMTRLRTAIERKTFEAVKKVGRNLPPETRAKMLNNLGHRLGGKKLKHNANERRQK